MGKTASRLSRPLKNWNVENRAHNVIEKDKPTVAPTYESTRKEIELVNKLYPNYKEESQKKNTQLNDNLKKVFVESNSREVQDINSRSNPDRPLPKERLLSQEFEFGFFESEQVKDGKVSLRQALKFIDDHNKDPEKFTAEVIAKKYKLDPKLTENILEYYKIFEIRKTRTYFNTDAIAKIPISQRSGIRIKHPVQPKKAKSEIDEVKKTKTLRQIGDE